MLFRFMAVYALMVAFALPAFAADPTPMDKEIAAIQSEWAVIKYQTVGKKAQLQAFDALGDRANRLASDYPDRAEPKIMQAAILSTKAAIIDGLSALPKVKASRDLLEKAMQLDHTALDGYGHTSLGALYGRVPGWPIAFGDKKKAEMHFEAALAIDADNLDANYYYGDFLIRQNDFAAAIPVLEKAIAAPDRPGRAIADQGRKAEARALLETAKENSNKAPRASYN